MDKHAVKFGPSRRVGVLPVPGFAMMSYAALTEPMRAANLLAGRELYKVVSLSTDGTSVQSSGAGAVLADTRLFADLQVDDLFVVAGGDPLAFDDRVVMACLARLARSGTILGGVSGGPVILARAGLMDGRRMTVHWEHAAALAEISPHLVIERSLYVIDRDRVSCAGGTAPMDLMHALISAHHGETFARQVSDWFMHTEVRPSAGPQRSGMVDRLGTTVPAILDAVAAMEAHVSAPLDLGAIAARAGVSSRQLNRLFRQKMNQSVMAHYRDLRLEKARHMLRHSALRLTDIALATGFANSAHFSRVYAEKYGEPPSAFR
ncbi:MAG: GlxA family transcriptional regulator [Pseudomonadota bacterium]